jgi:hypothetical protein
MALNGYWKNLWPERINDFSGFPKQLYEVRNIPVVTRKVAGEEFPDLDEAVSRNFATLMQERLLSEPEDGDLNAILERRQSTTVLRRKPVRCLLTWSIT